MIANIIRSIRNRRENAKAVKAQPGFLAAIESIEGLPLELQGASAMAFVKSMKKYRETVRSALPEPLQEDHLSYLAPTELQRAADYAFAQARIFRANAVRVRDTPQLSNEFAAGLLAAYGYELVGYYLLAASWLDSDSLFNLDDQDPALLNTSPMIGTYIQMRIHGFLHNFGHKPPF